MREALYRKYRPKKLSDVVGQDHITDVLNNALKNNKVSHAYLFSGPRGVGKTSIARIFAYQVNNKDYAEPTSSLDIIEIDAASNRRIDEIRELRDKVHVAPNNSRYKVYIIDEVHMLTREAFNALLKTLEEPPEHVIFILATTESHKLPETIISRTQRFGFKSVSENDVVKHLKNIAKKENINIDDDSLRIIASHGGGSFRDSISLLDQLSLLEKISSNDVRQHLGIPSQTLVEEIVQHTSSGNLAMLSKALKDAWQTGVQSQYLITILSDHLRDNLYNNNLLFGDDSINLLDNLLEASGSSKPDKALELSLIKVALPKADMQSSKPKIDQQVAQQTVTTKTMSTNIEQIQESLENSPATSTAPEQKIDSTDLGQWQDVLKIIKSKNNTLYGILKMANAIIDDQQILVSVPYAFHMRRINSDDTNRLVKDAIKQVFGPKISLVVEVSKVKSKSAAKTTKKIAPKTDRIEHVKKLFGGGEII